MSAIASLREFLFFPRAFEESKCLPEELRRELEQALNKGRQKHRAAHTLWYADQRAEGLRLAVEALQSAMSGVATLGRHKDSASASSDTWGAALAIMAKRGARPRALMALERARQASQWAAHTLADDAVPEAFEEVSAGWRTADRVLARVSASTAELTYRRWRRVFFAAMLLTFGMLASWKLCSIPWGLTATASSYYGNDPEYGPEQVLDGTASTEWLLPDGATGWLEIRAKSPRKIREVRILNGHNKGFNDRAVKTYRVEVFSRERLSLTVDGSFAFTATPSWVVHPIDVSGADRVRITVLSTHLRGGGLAEVQVR